MQVVVICSTFTELRSCPHHLLVGHFPHFLGAVSSLLPPAPQAATSLLPVIADSPVLVMACELKPAGCGLGDWLVPFITEPLLCTWTPSRWSTWRDQRNHVDCCADTRHGSGHGHLGTEATGRCPQGAQQSPVSLRCTPVTFLSPQ